MSRSYRHTPRCGVCICRSEKPWKREWHRRMRSQVRQKVRHIDPDLLLLPHDHEYSNPWAFGKDGKWRFDPRENPELMRK